MSGCNSYLLFEWKKWIEKWKDGIVWYYSSYSKQFRREYEWLYYYWIKYNGLKSGKSIIRPFKKKKVKHEIRDILKRNKGRKQ